MASKEINLDPIIEVLSRLAQDKVYGPLDMLSRVEDRDEFYMKMAREALYSAVRYYATEGQPVPELEDAVETALRLIESRPHVAKELALKALARAMSKAEEEQKEGNEEGIEEKKEKAE